MRKLICLLLSVLCLVCLFSACRSAADPSGSQTPTESTGPVDTTPSETTGATLPGEDTQPESTGTALLPGGDGEVITLGQTGKLRIPYTTARSGVRYITDPSQLPDYPELEGYDEAYFRDHALLLVTETVTSGSVNVEIASVLVENGIAAVTLDHQIPEGMGTADMATWLLWVEMDAGLEYSWTLTNPAVKVENEIY